jgi:deoxyribodipyrimidine photo-lyase
MNCALIWFRRDLRLTDNPALQAALTRGLTPLPVYVHDVRQQPRAGAASNWWLHHSLSALRDDLRRLGSDLLIVKGDSTRLLLSVAAATSAGAVYWNRLYEPQSIARDRKLKRGLRQAGLEAEGFGAALLSEPWDFGKADNTPYRVFTPFWKTLQKAMPLRTALGAPRSLPGMVACDHPTVQLEALELLPAIGWDQQFHSHWQPGEAGADRQLQAFLDAAIRDYANDRDRPALSGTSRLSPHLHFGEITAQQVWERTQAWTAGDSAAGTVAAAEAFLRQIAWRDFAHHLLFHFPHSSDAPLDARYQAFPWRGDYAAELTAWQKGRTGIPIVDAGMRELWATGWMHNRVRMISASVLTKNLLIPWQQGAAWFWDTLVDADLANNCFGWQWTAGCGADAAPYFRVFNPVTQGQRFDADGSYVRRWVPELQRLPAKWIHQPWLAPPQVLSAAALAPGVDYPLPLVELKASRERALAAWERVKHQTR